MRDDIAKGFENEIFQQCASSPLCNNKGGALWPSDSDLQWFLCPVHLVDVQTRYEVIVRKEEARQAKKVLKDFKKQIVKLGKEQI